MVCTLAFGLKQELMNDPWQQWYTIFLCEGKGTENGITIYIKQVKAECLWLKCLDVQGPATAP